MAGVTHSDPDAGRWDAEALRAGAGVTLVFAIPLTVLAAIVDSGSGGLNAVFFFGALFGFVLGAGCAAWLQHRGTPLSHGIVTAGGTYLVAQAIFIGIGLLTGRGANWIAVAFTLSLVLLAGVIGGLLGQRLQAKGFEPSARRPGADDRRST